MVSIGSGLKEIKDDVFGGFREGLGGNKDSNPIKEIKLGKLVKTIGKNSFPETKEVERELFKSLTENSYWSLK